MRSKFLHCPWWPHLAGSYFEDHEYNAASCAYQVGIAQRKNKRKTSNETKQIYFNMKDDLTTDTWYVTVATGREMIGRYSDKVGWIMDHDFKKSATEIHYV